MINIMKKVIFSLILILTAGSLINGQTAEIQGKPIAEIYTDFHYNPLGGTKTSGFGLNRAYFGYNFLTSENFSALIRVEIGSPEDLAAGSKNRRYAYYRNASITYLKDNLNITFGITETKLFDYQQKFWGKRYIANTFESLNKYGDVADLGIVADYKLSDKIEADLALMNGEGYSNIQLDDNLKLSGGITLKPFNNLYFRAYGDLMKTLNLWQTTFVGFAGYKSEKVTVGAEMIYKSNHDLTDGHNAWGFSGTGAVSLTKKLEIFARYDYSTSIIPNGETIQWNLEKDGSFLITGFQYTFNKYIKLALDNQANIPTDKTLSVADMIFLHALFKF
jgi:hypothetical protein